VTRREAQYVLDEITGYATDLPIAEHATDTHGVPLVNFALFRPGRVAALPEDPRPRQDHAASDGAAGRRGKGVADRRGLLPRRLNQDLIVEHWDDLLRLAGPIKFGQATASLIVGKLSASSRQNTLATALKEYGAIRRTTYAARNLADEGYRRRITRQLNKGELLHALRRELRYAHSGGVHLSAPGGADRAGVVPDRLDERRGGLDDGVSWAGGAAMRSEGRYVDDEALAHISPTHSENLNIFGIIDVDVEGELAKLDWSGYRSLRDAWPET
jgi:hypothetical protein